MADMVALFLQPTSNGKVNARLLRNMAPLTWQPLSDGEGRTVAPPPAKAAADHNN
jgi:hypothetical protein